MLKMADDNVDIEEHDLLDNPIIRRLFPNISVLKTEVLDFNDEVVQEIPVNDSGPQKTVNCPIKINKETTMALPDIRRDQEGLDTTYSDCIISLIDEGHQSDEKSDIEPDIKKAKKCEVKGIREPSVFNSVNYNIYKQKHNTSNVNPKFLEFPKRLKKSNVLQTSGQNDNQSRTLPLHSKEDDQSSRIPSTVISIIKSKSCCIEKFPFQQNQITNLRKVSINPVEESFLPWKGNKIILGSKYNGIKSQSKTCEKQSNLRNVKVLVENLETFLSKSSRYCKICFILFPSIKTLVDHKNLTHSQLNDDVTIHSNIFKKKKKSISVNNKNKICNVCGTVSSSSSNLLRHKRNVHSLNIKIKKSKKTVTHDIKPHDKLYEENKNFECTHCSNSFTSQQALIDHMYNVLQSKNKDAIKLIQNVDTDRKTIYKDMKSRVFYRCPFCSYYFKHKMFYVKHMESKHKQKGKIKIEKVAFDPLCKHCFNKYSHVKSFNVHVWKYHQKELKLLRNVPNVNIGKVTNISKSIEKLKPNTKRTQLNSNNIKKDVSKTEVHDVGINEVNTKNMYLLRSAFFRCIKCDVCFLNAKQAANHMKHDNTLIKWKCLKCSRIFIKEEQSLHMQQHLFGDNFDVFEVSESTYLYILYKCPNCASYFRENDFYNHFSICELQSPDSAYCKTCHILIDHKLKQSHDIHHKQKGDKELLNILVESDVITHNEGNYIKTKETLDIDQKELERKGLINILDKSDVVPIIEETDIKTEEKNYLLHSVKTLSSPLIKENTKRITKGPLRFIYCGTCKCFIFVSRVRKLYNHIKGRCPHLINYVCKYCGLVLSNKTIDSHRKMHQAVPDLTINDFKFHDLHSGKQIRPPIPKYPKCNMCGKHFITKTEIVNHTCNEDYLTCPLCKIKLSNSAFPLHLSFHNYVAKNKTSRTSVNLSVHPKELSDTKSTNLLEKNENNDNIQLLVYMCKICKVTVDSYDRVIEHCHDHIINQGKEIITKPCDSCNLIFDITCFNNHKMLHVCNQHKKFSILTYDSFYVTAVDDIWLNHLFGSLPKKEINKILGFSVYSFERKIRMQINQQGLSHLTYYKCATCKKIIEPSALYEHCQKNILCYKSKAVPCSICGIVLASEKSLMKHEKIHEKHQEITLKSYRIVLFNSGEDKIFNHTLSLPRQYVLYECRNCNGIVDKKQFQYHKCDFGNLSKCSHCGLLLYNNDYMPHVLKHNEFCSYHENNIKIILLGPIKDGAKINSRMKPSFRGIKLDYVVYQCNKCQVCLKDRQSSLTHDCVKDSAVTKCHICELYFEDFKSHRNWHDDDCYFSKENVTVLKLESKYLRSSDVHSTFIDDEEFLPETDGNTIRDNKEINISNPINIIGAENAVNKYDEIYRCLCGLHFLNEENALTHYNATKCKNPRIYKQICTKCGLSFRPSVLYSHLLKHHGNKNIFYKFNIIQIPNS